MAKSFPVLLLVILLISHSTVIYISCLLTPINILILQSYSLNHSIEVILFICDICLFFEFLKYLSNVFQKIVIIKYSHLLCLFLSFSSIYIIPILVSIGVSSNNAIWFSVLRLLSCILLPEYFHDLIISMNNNFFYIDKVVRRLVITFFGALMFSSTSACLWFYISCNGNLSDCDSGYNWVNHDTIIEINNYNSRYFRSLHFIMQTLFTIGYGDIHPYNDLEMYFTFIIMVCGCLFCAYLISAISSLLSNQGTIAKMFRNEMNLIRKYLHILNAEKPIKDGIIRCYDYLYTRQYGLTTNRILKSLPASIVKEMKMTLLNQLKSVPFFSKQRDILTELCVNKLSFETFPPGTVLYQKDEIKSELTLILTGKIDILSIDGSVLVSLVAGDFIGDFQMIFQSAISFSIICAVFTEVAVLNYQDLYEAIQDIDHKNNNTHLIRSFTSVIINQGDEDKDQESEFYSSIIATKSAYDSICNKVVKAQDSLSNSKSNNKKLIAMIANEEVEKVTTIIIYPDNSFRLVWDIFLIFGILYYNFSVPFRFLLYFNCNNKTIATDSNVRECLSQWSFSFAFDYLFDLLFVIDFILRMRYFALKTFEGETEVMETKTEILWFKFKYSTRFYIDLICAFPLDLLNFSTGYLYIFRGTKLLSLLLLGLTLNDIHAWLEKERNIIISSEMMSHINLGLYAVLVALWISTGWSIIHFYRSSNDLLSAFYWCFTTMTTVGYGDITPSDLSETIFNVFASCIGPIIFATLVAKFASYVKKVEESTDSIEYRRVVTMHYIKTLNFFHETESLEDNISAPAPHIGLIGKRRSSFRLKPNSNYETKSLHTMTHDYFEYLERDIDSIDENKLKAINMPYYMQRSLRICGVESVVTSCPLFESCEKQFLNELMLLLDQQIYCKNTNIVNKDGISFIKSGSVSISYSSERKLETKARGDFFESWLSRENCESQLLQIKASSDCEIWFLTGHYYNSLMSRFQTNRDIINSNRLDYMKCIELKKNSNVVKHLLLEFQQHHRTKSIMSKYIINPNGRLYMLWTILIIVFTIYDYIVIPYRIAYLQGVDISSYYAIDYVGDFVFIFDIILRYFFLGYYNQDDLVTDSQKIALNYKSNNFHWHILAVLPIDFFIFIGSIGTLGASQTLSVYRVNKLCRVIDLNSNATIIIDNLMSSFKNYFKVNKNFVKLFKLVLAIFMIAHLFGSFFFIIANQSHLHGSVNNWADDANILPSCSFSLFSDLRNSSANIPDCVSSDIINDSGTQFIHSFYWAITVLTTTGYGDICPFNFDERLYNILYFIVGTFIFAVLNVYLEEIISQLDVTQDVFNIRVDNINKFLDNEVNLPTRFRDKVSTYFTRLWSTQRGATASEIMKYLPNHIYLPLMKSMTQDDVSKLFFFNSFPLEFRNDFFSSLKIVFYSLDDCLFRTGEISNKLFLILNGEISLESLSSNQSSDDPNIRTKPVSDQRVKRFTIYDSIMKNRLLNMNKAKNKSENNTTDKTFYLKVREGFVGESEFLSRNTYSCCATVIAESTVCEIEFDVFWEIIKKHNLESYYLKLIKNERDKLSRLSTMHIVHKLDNNLVSSKMAKMLMTNVAVTKKLNYIHPNSITAYLYNVLIGVVFLIELLSIPYFIAFNSSGVIAQIVFDSIASAMYLVDIYFNIYYFAVIEDGNLINEQSNFSAMYMKKYLYIDIASCMPISILAYVISKYNIRLYSYLRLIYLIKSFKISLIFQNILSAIQFALTRKFNDNMIRITFTILILLYVTNVLTCIFCVIGFSQYDNGTSNWIEANDLIDNSSFYIYLRGYYIILYTVATVGYGSMTISSDYERIFCLLVMIIGSIISAALSAIFTSIIVAEDNAAKHIRRVYKASSLLCQSQGLSNKISKSIGSYFAYVSEKMNNSLENDDFALLSSSLKSEFVINKIFPLLEDIHFLNDNLFDKTSQKGFLFSLSHITELYIAIPGEVLAEEKVGELLMSNKSSNITRDILILRKGSAYSSVFDVRNEYQVGSIINFDFYKHSISNYKKLTMLKNIDSINFLLKEVVINESSPDIKKKFCKVNWKLAEYSKSLYSCDTMVTAIKDDTNNVITNRTMTSFYEAAKIPYNFNKNDTISLGIQFGESLQFEEVSSLVSAKINYQQVIKQYRLTDTAPLPSQRSSVYDSVEKNDLSKLSEEHEMEDTDSMESDVSEEVELPKIEEKTIIVNKRIERKSTLVNTPATKGICAHLNKRKGFKIVDSWAELHDKNNHIIGKVNFQIEIEENLYEVMSDFLNQEDGYISMADVLDNNDSYATAVADSHCHLFRIPLKKIQTLKNFYRLSQLPLTQRFHF